MGQYDITGKYPCIVKREGQLEYARYNYVNAIVMLEEVARLCHSPMREDDDIRRTVTTILCEIGVVAKDNDNEELSSRLKEITGFAFMAREDLTWRFVEQQILELVAYINGEEIGGVPFPKANEHIPALRGGGNEIFKQDSFYVYENRKYELPEILRLIHSPIPYYYFHRAIYNSIDKIIKYSPRNDFRNSLESARAIIDNWKDATDDDMERMETCLNNAISIMEGKGNATK